MRLFNCLFYPNTIYFPLIGHEKKITDIYVVYISGLFFNTVKLCYLRREQDVYVENF